MKKLLKNVVRPVFFLGLGVFFIWLITRNFTAQQWQQIRQAFSQANYLLLIPVLIIGIVSHYIRAVRWRLLLEPVGYLPARSNMFCAVMIGYLTNLAVPRLGEVARCGIVARQERIPVNNVIGTMVVERVVDIVSLLVIIFFTIVIQPGKVWHFFYTHIWQKLMQLFQPDHLTRNLLIVVGLLLVITITLILLRNTSWFSRIKKLFVGIRQGILMAFHLKQKGLFLTYTFFMWLCYFLMVYVAFYCFAATSELSIGAGLSVLSFGSIGMAVTQGGIGAYQLLVEKTLALYGIAEIYGFAYGWLSWLSQTALILVFGFCCMLALPFLKRKNN